MKCAIIIVLSLVVAAYCDTYELIPALEYNGELYVPLHPHHHQQIRVARAADPRHRRPEHHSSLTGGADATAESQAASNVGPAGLHNGGGANAGAKAGSFGGGGGANSDSTANAQTQSFNGNGFSGSSSSASASSHSSFGGGDSGGFGGGKSAANSQASAQSGGSGGSSPHHHH